MPAQAEVVSVGAPAQSRGRPARPSPSGHHLSMTVQLDNARVLIRPATAADQATLVEFRLAMLTDLFRHKASTKPRARPIRARCAKPTGGG